jgi:WD40 repeat protein
MEDIRTPTIQTLTGHLETVWSVAFSPDGKQIASGSDSGMIKLWDTTTGSLQKTHTSLLNN